MKSEGQDAGKAGQGFTSWIDGATPDEVISAGRQVLKRIALLDQTHRDRFVADLESDPTVARLFEDFKQPA